MAKVLAGRRRRVFAIGAIALGIVAMACSASEDPDLPEGPSSAEPRQDAVDDAGVEAPDVLEPAEPAPDAAILPGPGTFALKTVHPAASAQTTAAGGTIFTLQGFQGRLYAGYGDWSANTGPIAISAYDPGADTFTLGLKADTEAIWQYRILGSRLFAPFIDPRSGTGDLASGSPWAATRAGMLTHGFDMATVTGKDLWIVGAKDYNAVAYRSLDDGKTWGLAKSVPPPKAGDFSRFYFAGVLDGKLFLQVWDRASGMRATALAYDGKAWSAAPSFVPAGEKAPKACMTASPGWAPAGIRLFRFVTFAGRLVYRTDYCQGRLAASDGASAATDVTDYEVRDHTVSPGGWLYTVAADGKVRATRDLAQWQELGQAPAGAQSIAVLDGKLYVGASQAKIYAFSGSAP